MIFPIQHIINLCEDDNEPYPYDNAINTLRSRLLTVLYKKGYNQKEIAEMLGKSRNTIIRWTKQYEIDYKSLM